MSASEFALDTTAAIAVMERDPVLQQRLGRSAVLFVPVTVFGELYYGAERSDLVAENVARVEELRREVAPLVIDITTAREYGRLDQLQRAKGKPLPQNDLWIAASVVQHQLQLVTRDEHFQWIGGLRLVTW